MRIDITRRDFLKALSILCISGSLVNISSKKGHAFGPMDPEPHEAMFYTPIDEKTVQCELCSRGCTLSDGVRSFCRVREVKNGRLYTYAYGALCAMHVDPIEKKPLFHFLPGSEAFSIATAGCNYRCLSCQNWQISQTTPESVENIDATPGEIASKAIQSGSRTVAFTYTEPSIFYEYMLDAAKAAKAQGLRTMYHSNGSLKAGPLDELSYHLDAANIDLKGFTQNYYNDFCKGNLAAVKDAIVRLKKNRVWVEITNLIVPTMNDDEGKIREMCLWIKDTLGPDVPLHFSRFYPQHKLTALYPTPVETLERARAIAIDAGINYVYIGNVPGNKAENTYCPKCGYAVIRRSGYTIAGNELSNGKCPKCGFEIAGVWS